MSGRKLKYPAELPHWKGVSFLPDNKKVRKTNSWGDERRVARTIGLLDYLKNNPHPTIVPILDYVSISPTEYSYDMPLLAYISSSEGDLVHALSLSSETSNPKRRINRLRKKHPKLFHVVKKINSWKVYLDLYEDNLMRDQYGNYKLIDIEGFGLSRYSHHEIIEKITARR